MPKISKLLKFKKKKKKKHFQRGKLMKQPKFDNNLNFQKYMFEKYFHLKLTQECASNI